jgi:hypothetical protein
MNHILQPIGIKPLKASVGRSDYEMDLDTFSAELQKTFWKHVFNKMNLDRFFTLQVREKINKFAEQQEKIPFTMKNIYRMVEIIHGTKDSILKEALIEAVDNFTRHTHENRHMVEGWKTNSGYMLNEKFIIGYVRDSFYDYPHIRYSGRTSEMTEDLRRVLCNLTGAEYKQNDSLYGFFNHSQKTTLNEAGEEVYIRDQYGNPVKEYKEFGTWYKWSFFEIKMFKKGTLHVKFLDRNIWALLNQHYAKAKGQIIPENI